MSRYVCGGKSVCERGFVFGLLGRKKEMFTELPHNRQGKRFMHESCVNILGNLRFICLVNLCL